jgi:hypothetical protein
MIKGIERDLMIIEQNLELGHRERYLSEPDDWIRASDYIAEVSKRRATRYADLWLAGFVVVSVVISYGAFLGYKYLIK